MKDEKDKADTPEPAKPNVPVKDPHTETKGEAQSRHESEAQTGRDAAVQALRLSRYTDDGVESPDFTISRGTLLSFARTMQAIVDADTTKHRQAIADAALDGIDLLLYPQPVKKLAPAK